MAKIVFGLLVILTTGLMGSSFAIGKIGMEYYSPLLLVALRFTIAGISMALIVKVLKRAHPKALKSWLQIAVIGLFQTAGVMGCIFESLRTIKAGESSILTFMNPLLVVILGTIFLKSYYRIVQWAGVSIGFIGVFITLGGLAELKIGTFLGFLSAVSWAIATLLIKSWGRQFDTWVLTAYQMLFGGIVLLISSFLLEEQYLILNGKAIFILLWLAFMASIVQFAVWFYLLQKGDPGKTSAFLFLAPFFGVISGYVLLGEQITWKLMTGGIFIFFGIFLVNWTSKPGVKKIEDA